MAVKMIEKTIDHVTTWGELVLAVGGAAMAIWYGARRVYKMARNIEELLDNVRENGKLAAQADGRLDSIEKQLHPNGGSSVRDQLNRIEERVHALEHPVKGS